MHTIKVVGAIIICVIAVFLAIAAFVVNSEEHHKDDTLSKTI